MKSGTVSLHLAPVALTGSRDRQTGDSVWPKDATGLKSGEDSVNGRDQCSQCAPIHVCVWHGRDRMMALTHSLTHSLASHITHSSLPFRHFLWKLPLFLRARFSLQVLLHIAPCLGAVLPCSPLRVRDPPHRGRSPRLRRVALRASLSRASSNAWLRRSSVAQQRTLRAGPLRTFRTTSTTLKQKRPRAKSIRSGTCAARLCLS